MILISSDNLDEVLKTIKETFATISNVNNHVNNNIVHVTADERTAWNAKSSLTLGTTSSTAFRGDQGLTAYNHSQTAHAPSNAQKNSDITKAEIEAKLTGTITSHNHSGTYAPASHNHASNTINAMTGYSKPSSTSAISTSDSLNSAIGKLEKSLSDIDAVVKNIQATGSTLTLGETSTTAYRGDRGKIAYDHSQASHNYIPMTGGTASGALGAKFNNNTIMMGIGDSDVYVSNEVSGKYLQLKNNGTLSYDDHLIYHEGNKPSPADIGAASSSHGTHLTLGTGSGNAYRGDYGNIAYNHSQTAHAPSNAQKNSDITKAEIEAKLTGSITAHYHTWCPINNNIVTSTGNDTTSKWGSWGLSAAWYSTLGQLNGQPSQYGFLLNMGQGQEVRQLWFSSAQGDVFHRGGNGSGWSGSWRKILDEYNTKLSLNDKRITVSGYQPGGPTTGDIWIQI
jgi:hypothetical protein